MNPLPTPSDAHDLRSDIRRALASANDQGQGGYSGTSDLTMDEELNLHSIGWEPVELVSGLSVFSVATGYWNWGQGEILGASAAHAMAFQHASSRLHSEAAAAGGHGVVGVHIERFVHPTHIEVTLLGTAVRPVGSSAITASEVFISDLSARDFTLLMVAGWQPLGLATGASFVYAPRRSVGTILQQQSQNVELKNFTEAMYSARSTAMQRMQDAAIKLKGAGVVEVKVVEGPMHFAPHAVGFASWGTVVRLSEESHRLLHPTMIISLNDPLIAFDASILQ